MPNAAEIPAPHPTAAKSLWVTSFFNGYKLVKGIRIFDKHTPIIVTTCTRGSCCKYTNKKETFGY